MASNQYVSYSEIFQHRDNIWLVNTKPSGIYTTQMKSMLDQLEAVLTHYSQVLVLRFDIGIPYRTRDNRFMVEVMKSLKCFLRQNYKMRVFGYHWTREEERAKKQHYHVALILDANKVSYPSRINNFILELGNTIGVRPWIPKNCFYRFKRNEHDKKQGAIWRISYLAKARGKGKKPAQTKNHGSSRIRVKGANDKVS